MADEHDDTTTDDQEVDTAEAGNQPDEASDEVKTTRQIASRFGWKPKDQWVEGKKPWQDADKFLETFGDSHDKLRSELRDVRHTMTNAIAEQRRISERDKARAVAEAKAGVRQAAIDGDAQAIEDAAEALANAQSAPVADPSTDPAVIAFAARNESWFGSNRKATALAKSTAELAAQAGLSYAEQVKEAEEAVRDAYPNLFEDSPAPRQQQDRRPAPVVNGNAQRTAPTNKPTVPAHVMKTFAAVAKADPRITVEAQSQIWLEEQAARKERA